MEVKLDRELYFSPDILVSIFRTNRKGIFAQNLSDECLGQFSVPLRCCEDGFEYPHYFNVVRNNEKNGRVLANFFIETKKLIKKNDNETPNFKNFNRVFTWLHQPPIETKVEVAIIGFRDLDFSLTVDEKTNEKLEVSITGQGIQKPKKDLSRLHFKDLKDKDKKENFINILEIFQFDKVKFYGTNEFMIFPILTIRFKYTTYFFIEQERFLITSLKDHYANQIQEIVDSNANNLKRYLNIWEQNLDTKRIDQELVDVLLLEDKNVQLFSITFNNL